MTEKDSIKELEDQSRNSRHFVDRVNEAHYDVNMGDLIKTVGKLADVMARLIEREADHENGK